MSEEVKVIVFDFDGVLVDSVQLKFDALKENFIEYGEDFAQDVLDDHHSRGTTRFEAAAYAKEKLDNKNNDFIEKHVGRYTAYVKDKIVRMPLNAAADMVILDLVKRLPVYISSGTPEDELKDILRSKTMLHLFQEVYGSPDKKEEHFRKILEAEYIDPKNVLFIGDMPSDHETARRVGCQFLGINFDTSKVEESIETVEKLIDILEVVEKRNKKERW